MTERRTSDQQCTHDWQLHRFDCFALVDDYYECTKCGAAKSRGGQQLSGARHCEHGTDLTQHHCLLCDREQRPSNPLREFWICVQPPFNGGDAYSSRAIAEEAMVAGDIIVHVREVLPDVAAPVASNPQFTYATFDDWFQELAGWKRRSETVCVLFKSFAPEVTEWLREAFNAGRAADVASAAHKELPPKPEVCPICRKSSHIPYRFDMNHGWTCAECDSFRPATESQL